MLSGKAAAATKPTALGSLLQAATYGQTIPVIYGMTQSPILAIWAANIRQGGSVKKFKQFLKGITEYVENIDFLLGHNPIMGVQQMWNNGSPIPLNFISVEVGTAGSAASYSISDLNFYALIGVTVTCAINPASAIVFNDYGGGGPSTPTGNYAVPCWNTLQSGPAWNGQQRYFPFTYQWSPLMGASFNMNDLFIYPVETPGTITAYYTQLKAATSFLPPLQKEFLFFEPELGSGPEYAEANLTSQQIIYPMFAGVGSSNMDLGAAGVIPQLQAEVQGKWGVYPTGDGDFADMIEDVFRSGVAQAAIGANPGTGIGFTGVEHGLSAYDFPAPIQNQIFGTVDGPFPPITYSQSVTQGNFLVVAASHTTGTLAINDTLGLDWTPVISGATGYQVWWAPIPAGGPCTITITGWATYYPGVQLFEIAGADTFDSATVGTSPNVSQVTTNQQGFPAFILTVSLWSISGPTYNTNPTISGWKALNAPNSQQNASTSNLQVPGLLTFSRIVKTPGTYPFTMLQPSSNPDAICALAFKCASPPANPYPVGDFIDSYSVDCVRLQCRANGLWGSLTMDSQQAASDWLTMLYQAADAAPVFMGFKLFSVPYSEVSAVGNGAIYYAPTACGPVANLSTENGDFVGQNDAAPITVKTAARVDQPNVLQMQCVNRSSNYNPSVVEQPDAASISLFGVRKADPVVNNAVQDVSIARKLLGIMVRKLQYGGDVWSFTLPANRCLLSPMDLITVTDPLSNFDQVPLRLTSIAEQNDGSLQCEAEPFVYGMYAPNPFNTDSPTPFQPNPTVNIGPINSPVIFEPVPGLIGSTNQGEIWLVVSDADPNYGGAQVYVSTDGGDSYNPVGNPIIGNGVTGYTVNDWPAAASPDTTNDLSVNLTESAETLQSYSVADEDSFLYPSYVESQTALPVLRGSTIASSFSTGLNINLPAGCQVGDLCILFACAGNNLAPFPATGWTDCFEYGNTNWCVIALSKTLNSGDIATGFFNVQCISGPFDMHGAIAVFEGPTGGVRETEGQWSAGGGTITNVTSSAVVNTDVAIYWASNREDPGATLPGITPAVGAANTLGTVVTTNAYSIIADQTMPGGVLSVGTTFPNPGGGLGDVAVQVIVQALVPTTIPYELMTYAVANLTSLYNYTLKATGAGNHLDRGVFGAPVLNQGVDHPNNSRYAFLPPTGQGIAKLPLLPAYIGQTLYFKIVPFNTFGVAGGTLSDATPYEYTVLGTSGSGAGGMLVNGN